MNMVNEGVLPPDELDDRDERREEQESARSRETFADIVADLRKCAQCWKKLAERIKDSNLGEPLKTQTEIYGIIADRIEAVWKRDEERAVEHATRHAEAVARDNCRDCVYNPRGKNYEGGNAAAMREALEAIRDLAYEVQDMNREGDVKTSMPTTWMIDIVSAALADATTEKSSAVGNAAAMRECALVWAQMPYEASEISRAHRAGEKTTTTNQTTRNNNEQ